MTKDFFFAAHTKLRLRSHKMNQTWGSRCQATTFTYRVATGNDAAFLQRLVEDSFRHPDSWTGDTSGVMAQYSISLNAMMEKITKPGSSFIIVTERIAAASQGDELVDDAVVACFQVVRKSSTLARFATFAIAPRHQSRGLGRQIVQYAEEYCQEIWGSAVMQLNTLSSRTALLRWYERLGYNETGVKEPFPPASFGGGFVGKEELYFAVMEKALIRTVTSAGTAFA